MAEDNAARPALYYRHHVFVCLNDRGEGEDSCAARGALAGFAHCKQAVKAAGLWGPGGVRVNKAGCFNRCAGGPVAVVYPEGRWYTFVDGSDIDELVLSLQDGTVVERLELGPEVGR